MRWIFGISIGLLCFATPLVISYPDPAFLTCWHQYQEALAKVHFYRESNSLPKFYTDSIRHPIPPIYKPGYLSKVVPSNRTIILALGPGTTATHGLIADLHRLNIPSVHWRLHAQVPDTLSCASFLERWNQFCVNREFRSMSIEEMYMFIQTFMTQYQCVSAFMDYPIPEMFLYLRYVFPNAIYLFTDREPTAWAKSRVGHDPYDILVIPIPNLHTPFRDRGINVMAALFKAHRDFVHCAIPPDRILDLNYFASNPSTSSRSVELSNYFINLSKNLETRMHHPRNHSSRIQRSLMKDGNSFSTEIARFLLPRLNPSLDDLLISDIIAALEASLP